MMRLLPILCVVGACLAGPCDDPQYVALKDKPIAEMTPQEYDYYKTAKAACEEDGARGGRKRATIFIVIGALVATAAVITSAAMIADANAL